MKRLVLVLIIIISLLLSSCISSTQDEKTERKVVPLGTDIKSFLLKSDELESGIFLGAVEFHDITLLNNVISELERHRDEDPDSIDAFINYTQLLLDNGFHSSVSISNQDESYSQEIVLCKSITEAETIMKILPEPTLDLVRTTFVKMGLIESSDINSSLVDFDKTGFSSDSWCIYMDITIAEHNTIILYETVTRVENLILILTLVKVYDSIQLDSTDTFNEIMDMSRKAVQKVESKINELEPD